MNKAYKKIFWGVLLGTFRLELGPISVIPAFLAWVIVHLGITDLIEYNKEISGHCSKNLMISKKVVEILVGLTFLGSLGQWMDEGRLFESLPFLYYPVILMMLGVTAMYYFIESMIETLLTRGLAKVADDLRAKERIYLVISFTAMATIYFGLTFPYSSFVTFGSIVGIIGNLYLLVLINSQKKREEMMATRERKFHIKEEEEGHENHLS